MKINILRPILLVLFLVVLELVPRICRAQENKKIEISEKKQVIETISTLLEKEYIVPEMTPVIIDSLQTKLKNGKYDKADTQVEFADMIFRDLYIIGDDKHFYFYYDPHEAQLINWENGNDKNKKERAHKEYYERGRLKNFGFEKIERLKGNIGFLDLRYFENVKYGGETAIASMQFLSNCDAIIIDLRENRGGMSNMVRLISSYFLEEETLIRTMEFKSGKKQQGWTLPYVPGKKMNDKKLYILTSKNTGSAAEQFSYYMKNSERAVLIGDVTRGAAHNIREAVILDKYILHLADKKPIDPNTKTNWEKVGVTPNIQIESELAFEKAYQLAIENLIKDTETKSNEFELNWMNLGLQAELDPITLSSKLLQLYTGGYADDRKIILIGNTLFYKKGDNLEYKLQPLSEDIFKIININEMRIKFIRNDGKIDRVELIYEDGYVLRKKKIKSL